MSAAAVDQGQSGQMVQATPAQGVTSGSVAHVGQLPLEPEDPDQHGRLCNQPASATSVTCKRLCSGLLTSVTVGLVSFEKK